MLSGRSRLVLVIGNSLFASVLCGPALGQDAPRRNARTANRSAPPAPRAGKSQSVYGPKAPPQVAARPHTALGGRLGQFAPQPRRPQASWGQLSPEEESELELVLQAWEKQTSEVKTLYCTFQSWKYDKVFGKADVPSRIYRGVILYAAPDKGHYRITEEAEDPTVDPPSFVKRDGEYWVCDGNAVYEFNYKEKQLIERRLPDELKGKAISNSPLPFVFGTTAAQMRQRYWMRLVTPPDLVGKKILLRVEPMHPEDRANYQRATVVLAEKQMMPKAVSLELPNGNSINYLFDPPSINNPWKKFWGVFEVPGTPRGWKRIVEDPPTPGNRPAPPADSQTLRVPIGPRRK
ncbi:MAG TPA: TIGR03009 domain-containing protein [Pirellulales bacterium]|nr:TIGR03009 domain-containing protein [Pirellulales bacterium]